MPPAVRAGVTPKRNADRDIGAWNTFEITMRGDRSDGGPQRRRGRSATRSCRASPHAGAIALQHHGSKKGGVWISPPSLVQFRNISIKEL